MEIQDDKKQAQARIRQIAADLTYRTPLEYCSHKNCLRNLSCGDEIEVHLLVENGHLQALGARIEGCLVVQAAWTLIARALANMDCAEAEVLLNQYLAFLDHRENHPASVPDSLATLAPFRRPSPRVLCARLPAHALLNCLSNRA